MFNFDPMISAAARVAGDRPILAAPFPLSPVVCQTLAAQGLITGYIAESAPDTQEPKPLIAGWWVDRAAGLMFLRQAASPTMLMLSAAAHHQLSGGLLLEARLKGVRRILFVTSDGSIVKQVDVVSALLRMLQSVSLANPVHQASYDDLFADIYTLLGDRMRLPHDEFVPGRILILIGSLGGGGAERQAAYTAAGLSRRFPGRIAVARCYEGQAADLYKPQIDAAGVASYVIPSASPEYEAPEVIDIRHRLAERYLHLNALSIFQIIFHHALLIRELRPEVVHTWLDYSNTLGGVAADLVGAPRLVLSSRSLAPDRFMIFQPYMKPAYRALLARRDVTFLNNSKAGARDYARWLGLPADRFRVIPNGFELPALPANSRSAMRQMLGFDEDAVVVGSIFGFREEKRPLLWIEMARLLHQAYPQLRFVIFGDGGLLPACRALVEAEGLAGVIVLPGLTSDAWAALSVMDIFVLTSRAEGLPNVMIEAQLVGVPVVCTGSGGMYETFVEGETGFGFPEDTAIQDTVTQGAAVEGTARALADAVVRLVADPSLRRRMGERARCRAERVYGIARLIDETIDAYGSTADRSADPAIDRSVADWPPVTGPGPVRLGGIVHDSGDCFAADLPITAVPNGLFLWEDDYPLERAAADDAALAAGRFRIVGARIFFTSSDYSDPRFNGRSYCLRAKHAGFEEIVLDTGAILADNGHCYIAVPGLGKGTAAFTLWEDGRRLGPASCVHDAIRLNGGGRYSVWGECVYFSASDGSDPRCNGRRYALRRDRLGLDPPPLLPAYEGLSLDAAFRYLLAGAEPRFDFVPGRIVHVIGNLGPGGAERQMVYTTAGLVEAPIESVQTLCYYMDPIASCRYDFYLSALRAAHVPVRGIRRCFGTIEPDRLEVIHKVLPQDLVVDIADLYREFIELRPEIVHAWLDGNLERVGIAAALAGVPRIVLAGRNVNPTHFDYYRPHMDAAYKALLALTQTVMINNSIAGRDDYAEWLGIERSRIRVLYNGIEFAEYTRPGDVEQARLRERHSLASDSFVIGGVFRFAAEKRPLLWIETAAAIAQRLPNAGFILFGDGELRGEMERLADRLGLGQRLIFAGITTEILDMLAMMDVLLLTSAHEGLPNVVLEAQWAGTPVVATRAGGTPEAIEEGVTGWTVDPPTADALADRLVLLHDDPMARREARHRGPAFVKERFGVARMVEETLHLYGMRAAGAA